jgi:DNA adenine methylase (dam)
MPTIELELTAPADATLSAVPQRNGQFRPPLKWAGGKTHLVPRLNLLYADHRHRRLIEPFVGGLAVSLGLVPSCALLNDVNPHLVNFYRQLQNGLRIDLDMQNDSEKFYEARTRFNELLQAGRQNTQEAASLFYYLNRTCFNGLCRFNSKGSYNVPFGKYKTINYTRDFTSYQPLLARWEFRLGDFATIPTEPDDFIYADPPYDVEFTKYSADDFKWNDQIRLAEWLAAHPGPVVASNQATDRIIALYEGLGFQVETLPAPRRISCNGDRSDALEILALKNIT